MTPFKDMVFELLIVHPVKAARVSTLLQIFLRSLVIVVFGQDVATTQVNHLKYADSQIFVNALGNTGTIV